MLTAAETADGTLQPTDVWAYTRKTYDVPDVSPVQVHVVVGSGYANSDHVAPPSVDTLTTYMSIAAPPLLTGGVHDTSTDVDVAFDPTTPVGAPGTVEDKVLTAAEAADGTLQPDELWACIRKR